MSVVYYGSRISENMTKTPEGILICHNVPIGRSGEQTYLSSELGLSGELRKVSVLRDEAEVFSPAAVASYEGKPVTNDHPPGLIDVTNMSSYIRGTTKNVRRGTGPEADFLLADLVIYDPILIQEIENGKREVSSGYACVWAKDESGIIRQQNICGNHVAVVRSGRAGPRVAIKDSATEERKGEPRMDLKTKLARLFFRDENFSADEVPELLEMLAESEEGADPPVEEEIAVKEEVVDEGGDRLARIEALLEGLLKMLAPKPEPELDSLGELEKELVGDESATIEPEKESEEVATDSLALIRSLKPAIAQLPASKRKAASDSLAALLRMNMQANPYAEIAQNLAAKAAKAAQDSQSTPVDQSQLGKQWAEQYHPKRD